MLPVSVDPGTGLYNPGCAVCTTATDSKFGLLGSDTGDSAASVNVHARHWKLTSISAIEDPNSAI